MLNCRNNPFNFSVGLFNNSTATLGNVIGFKLQRVAGAEKEAQALHVLAALLLSLGLLSLDDLWPHAAPSDVGSLACSAEAAAAASKDQVKSYRTAFFGSAAGESESSEARTDFFGLSPSSLRAVALLSKSSHEHQKLSLLEGLRRVAAAAAADAD